MDNKAYYHHTLLFSLSLYQTLVQILLSRIVKLNVYYTVDLKFISFQCYHFPCVVWFYVFFMTLCKMEYAQNAFRL